MKPARSIHHVNRKKWKLFQVRHHRSGSLEFHLWEHCECDISLATRGILTKPVTNIPLDCWKN